MHKAATTWPEFREAWDGLQNFMMTGLVDFGFDFPPLAEVVDQVRTDSASRITRGDSQDQCKSDDIAESFRALPIDVAMLEPFALAHFKLSCFDRPGGFLHGFRDRVLDAWQQTLTDSGFTWDRLFPILFISGAGCWTGYHMDCSHVMAWQVYGHKRFCGLLNPDRWAPDEIRRTPYGITRPAGLTDDDALCYDMAPGDMLWNKLLTPHWVNAGDDVAMSINISHGGLRLNGCLAPFEEALEAYRRDCPETAPALVPGGY
jgi:hypothetical protein